jgi:NADH:ubiquinone reductase (H+-translocating)
VTQINIHPRELGPTVPDPRPFTAPLDAGPGGGDGDHERWWSSPDPERQERPWPGWGGEPARRAAPPPPPARRPEPGPARVARADPGRRAALAGGGPGASRVARSGRMAGPDRRGRHAAPPARLGPKKRLGPQASTPAGPRRARGPASPGRSRVAAVVFRHRPRSHTRALTGGLLLGLAWWAAVSLTVMPLLMGRPVAWSATAAGDRLPSLLGALLFSSLAGLLFHEAASRHLDGGRRSPGDAPAPTPTRVVILGGGFGGVGTARQLERLLPRLPNMQVTVVSQSNALLFTPMLAEVASSSLEPNHISVPVRGACPRTRFRLAEVESVDTRGQLVHLRASGAQAAEALPYDHLVLALGAVPNYLNLPGVQASSLPLKTIGDATRLRNHVISRLEQADVETDPDERRRQLTFVVAGGGFAGVEMMAGLCDLVHSVRRYFPHVTAADPRFVLVHGRDRILPETGPELGEYAQRKLQGRGVHFLLNTRVVRASAQAVALSDGSHLPTRTLVWAAGNRPTPLLASLPFERSLTGAVLVDPTLRVLGTANVWAVGDCAQVPDRNHGGRPFPPTAQHALRQGKAAAQNIVGTLEGRRPKPFAFRTLGFLVTLGHGSAAADIRGRRFSGVLAWLMWRGIYLSKLPGTEKRLRVLLDWTIELFFPRDIALTMNDPAPRSSRSRSGSPDRVA